MIEKLRSESLPHRHIVKDKIEKRKGKIKALEMLEGIPLLYYYFTRLSCTTSVSNLWTSAFKSVSIPEEVEKMVTNMERTFPSLSRKSAAFSQREGSGKRAATGSQVTGGASRNRKIDS